MSYVTICTDCSAKSYYAAAKANDPNRKIMQIPLFLGAIGIFYVSDETQLRNLRFHIRYVTCHTTHTSEQ